MCDHSGGLFGPSISDKSWSGYRNISNSYSPSLVCVRSLDITVGEFKAFNPSSYCNWQDFSFPVGTSLSLLLFRAVPSRCWQHRGDRFTSAVKIDCGRSRNATQQHNKRLFFKLIRSIFSSGMFIITFKASWMVEFNGFWWSQENLDENLFHFTCQLHPGFCFGYCQTWECYFMSQPC